MVPMFERRVAPSKRFFRPLNVRSRTGPGLQLPILRISTQKGTPKRPLPDQPPSEGAPKPMSVRRAFSRAVGEPVWMTAHFKLTGLVGAVLIYFVTIKKFTFYPFFDVFIFKKTAFRNTIRPYYTTQIVKTQVKNIF